MSADVSVAVASDPIEAEEIRAVLLRGGVAARIASAEVDDAGPVLDGPCRVLVDGASYELAVELLEAEDDDEDEDLA